ncbi:MAG: hypothetical protein FWJ62_05375 [Thermaerobacter sp.]|nr:hypothetical protein [Bacillota bacterium]
MNGRDRAAPRLLVVAPSEAPLPGEVLRRCGVTLAGRLATMNDVLGLGPDLRLDVVVWFDPPLEEDAWVGPSLELARLRPATGLVLVPARPEAVGPLEVAILDRRERGQLQRVTAAGRGADDLVRGICRVLADAGLGRKPGPAADLAMLRPAPRSAPGDLTARRAPAARGDGRGRILTVFGPKGGVGKTTVAVGLAALAAAANPEGVVIVDLDLEAAAVAVHLDLLDAPDLLDVLPSLEADPRRVPRFAGAPLAVVPGPARPQLAAAVEPDLIDRILAGLAGAYRWVVVDVGARLGDEVAYRAIAAADRLVFVLTPDASSLRTARLLMDHAGDLGLDDGRLVPVLNQTYGGALLDARRIGDFLGLDIRHTVPLDRAAVDASILNGRPLVLEHPGHPIARALRDLAQALGMDVAGPAGDGRPNRAAVARRWWKEVLPWKA